MCIKQQTNRIWTGGPDPDGNKVALQLYRWIGDGDLENGPDGADPLDEFANGVLIPKEAVGEVHYVDQQTGWSSQKLNDIYNHEGQPYQYTIREVHSPYTVWPNPERYEQKITGNKETDADGNPTAWNFTVSNEYRSPQTDIVASKIWIGGDYSYPRILIDLFRYPEGKEQEKELVVDGKSSATTQFSPYHVYKEMDLTNEEGIPYVYRIEEREITELTQELIGLGFTQADIDALQNYKTERNKEEDPLGVNDENLSIINRYVSPLIKVNATKVWEGGNPDNRPVVTLQLLQNGVPYNGEEGEKLADANAWKAKWTQQEATNSHGEPYVYSVEELHTKTDFTADISGTGTEADPFVITNSYTPGTTKVTALKRWVGGPADKPPIELTLYRKTEAMEQAEPVPAGLPLIGQKNPVVVENGEPAYTWDDLPVTDANGNIYTYSVIETAIDGEPVAESLYTPEYNGMLITNTYRSDSIEVQALKRWPDGNEHNHVLATL